MAVMPNGSGTLIFTIEQFPTPEPASAALIGTGLLLAPARRKAVVN